jgi:lysophospholipase L1-like esterase
MGEFSSANEPDHKPARALHIRPWLARWLPRLVFIAQAGVCIALVRAWANSGTHRLYLADRVDVGSSSEARQRFVVEGTRVVPQILTHDTDGFRFALPETQRGQLRFRVRAKDRATIDVRWADGERKVTLERSLVSGQHEIARPLPASRGVLDLSSQGPVVWSDLRVEETFPWWPHTVMLGLLLVVGWALPRTRPAFAVEWTPRERFVLVRTAAAITAAAIAMAALEAGLRIAAWASPSLMAVERSRLGEVAPDPHWQDSPRYGRVPRPNRDANGEWTLGDIVRMGFVPEGMSPRLLHRFPVRTDAEGFRNDTPPGSAEVAALGDSFTDALTLPLELGWPARLEGLTGRRVRNYGVAGFGPQQELRVLQDHVLPRRPRVVVVAFFAGNDIPGAALFEDFERSGGASSYGVAGWPFKRVVARFDRSYAFLLAQQLLGREARADGPDADPSVGRRFDAAFSGEDPAAPAAERPSFDRGMYTLPVAGRTLRFAFMPPYLNLLNLGRAELEAHRGWALTRSSLLAMKARCDAAGARLVVMFIPSKSQVYLPLAERALARPELRRSLAFSLPADPWGVDPKRLLGNRLAQNELMAGFCGREGIELVDVTPDLAATAAQGLNVYFPDDSHWNARGHQVAAERLARFLAER